VEPSKGTYIQGQKFLYFLKERDSVRRENARHSG